VRSAVAVAGLLVLLAIPLIVALGVLREPRWYPAAELAHTELRLRDVGTRHTPLTGVFSPRMAGYGGTTSHPGPLPLFGMWPVYRLLGASAWAMQAASIVTHVVAMGVCLLIAHRRGGARLALGCAVVVLVLARAYGVSTLSQAWNPYLPLLWFVVFLLAVWSVVERDRLLLPVAVFAGSYCIQSHVAYAGIVGALVAVAFAATLATRGGRWRWTLAGLAVGALVWLPPALQQLTSSHGNLAALWSYFRHPDAPAIGLTTGARVLLVHLDPWTLLARRLPLTMAVGPAGGRDLAGGSLVPGIALLAAFVTSALVARRLRHRPLVSLHLVVALAMVASAISMGRIFGELQYWLVLYAWTINAVALFAVGWTTWVVLSPRLNAITTAAVAAALALLVAPAASFARTASQAAAPLPDSSRVVAALAPATISVLRHGEPYLVTWNDQTALDLRGWALFDELDRAGFDVRVPPIYRGAGTDHRVAPSAEGTAVIHLENGAGIGAWRAKAGVREVAYFDPRTRGQRLQFERLRAEVIAGLRRAGQNRTIRWVDGANDDDNLVYVGLDPAVPLRLRLLVDRMLYLGLPTAVFVGPARPA
jgi:hypothetical protein